MNPTNKLSNILKMLHVPNHFKIALQILGGSDMLKYQHMYPDTPLLGGAKKTNEVIEYKGAKFIFYYYGDKYSITYTLHPQNDTALKCSVVIVDVKGKHTILHGLTYDPDCFEDPKCKKFGDGWQNGSTLLKISLDFIKLLRTKYEINYIVLVDNSQKYCEKVGKMIDLDSFLMLTTGNTWYGKYGFVPFDTTDEKTNILVLKDYKRNQKIVTNTLVKNTNIKKILLTAIDKYSLDFDVNYMTKALDKYITKDVTIMKCLIDLAKKYDKTCVLFYYTYKNIMADLKMRDLHGTTYWKKL